MKTRPITLTRMIAALLLISSLATQAQAQSEPSAPEGAKAAQTDAITKGPEEVAKLPTTIERLTVKPTLFSESLTKVFKSAAKMPNLQFLSIRFGDVQVIDFAPLAKLKKLNELHLNTNYIIPLSTIKALVKLPTIRTLKITGNWTGISSASLALIQESLHDLRVFSVVSSGVEKKYTKPVIEAIALRRKLKSIKDPELRRLTREEAEAQIAVRDKERELVKLRENADSLQKRAESLKKQSEALLEEAAKNRSDASDVAEKARLAAERAVELKRKLREAKSIMGGPAKKAEPAK